MKCVVNPCLDTLAIHRTEQRLAIFAGDPVGGSLDLDFDRSLSRSG